MTRKVRRNNYYFKKIQKINIQPHKRNNNGAQRSILHSSLQDVSDPKYEKTQC